MPPLCTSRFCFGQTRYSLEHYSDAVSQQVAREVMDGTSYPIYPFPKGRIRKILDLGAHVGAATIYFHCHYPESRITAVEPHPEYAKILRRNLATNQIRAKFIEAAYVVQRTRIPGPSFMRDGKHGPCSSTVGHFGKSSKTIVSTINSHELSIQSFDLVKIDVEGCEKSIFAETPRKTWKDIAMIYVEYHDADTRHLIDGMLRRTHILAHARIYHPSTGELAYVARRYVE